MEQAPTEQAAEPGEMPGAPETTAISAEDFQRSCIFGTFLSPELEREYVAILCEQWRRRTQILLSVLTVHFILIGMATGLKWTWYPFQHVGSMLHNGTLVNLHDLAPATGSQNTILPIFSASIALASFTRRLYSPNTFRWLISGFIITVIILAYVPQIFGYLSLETSMSPPLLDGIARPSCPFASSYADAPCAAQWAAWHGRFPRTTRTREEAASWYMAVTAMYFVMIAALPLPTLISLAFCIFLGVVSWSEASMAIRVVYGDRISYTPFTQLTFLSVAVVYIARIRDTADRQAFVSQRLLVAKNAQRLEQLIQSKERAEYDRALAQKSLTRLEQAVLPARTDGDEGEAYQSLSPAGLDKNEGNGVLQREHHKSAPPRLSIDDTKPLTPETELGDNRGVEATPNSMSGSFKTESELGDILGSRASLSSVGGSLKSNSVTGASSDAGLSDGSSVMLSGALKTRLNQTLSDINVTFGGGEA